MILNALLMRDPVMCLNMFKWEFEGYINIYYKYLYTLIYTYIHMHIHTQNQGCWNKLTNWLHKTDQYPIGW